MKIVINTACGGFGLSATACKRYFDLKGQKIWITTTVFDTPEVWLVPEGERIQDLDFVDYMRLSDEEKMTRNALTDAQMWYDTDVDRNDPLLIQIVEELGEAANGRFAKLKIVDIPEEIDWYVDCSDAGAEWVAEKHRTWS